MFLENENTEFKSQFTDEIYKEVIAFANTEEIFLLGSMTKGMESDWMIPMTYTHELQME